MKETTGELNLAVIVAISVGILVAFFFTFLWPKIHDNYESSANCRKALCDCSRAKQNNYRCTCWMPKNESNKFECPWEG